MILQLSSGSGPTECERAVYKLTQALLAEFPDCEVIRTTPGQRAGCYKSVQIHSERGLSFLEGSVLWVCQSPFRPKHRRKNWFVDVSVVGRVPVAEYSCEEIRFETFRSGGKGGQHVNKVETGVRAVHIPTGLSAASTTARSQQRNKSLALERLNDILAEQNRSMAGAVGAMNRMEHYRIQRGNPIRVYRGQEFILDGVANK